MMKVIVSHDVDHLFGSDHVADLIYPKLWVRETLALVSRRVSPRQWARRMISPFHSVRHHIDELMAFDREHGVPATYFFGMAKGLGMSYKAQKALPVIQRVRENGFDVGVHGIDFQNAAQMQAEYDRFKALTGMEQFGIRNHYVRFDEETFRKMEECGYLFDTTQFDKQTGCCLEAPYKVGKMIEFPLTVMDGYLPKGLEQMKKRTRELLNGAQAKKLPYFCVLFHDYQFCNAYEDAKSWYIWLIQTCKERGLAFTDYRHAIAQMEGRRKNDG